MVQNLCMFHIHTFWNLFIQKSAPVGIEYTTHTPKRQTCTWKQSKILRMIDGGLDYRNL